MEIANWQLRANLVVLSACCSGQRPISGRWMEELPGDELFGLQSAFFMAGARRMLSCLWPVDDAVFSQRWDGPLLKICRRKVQMTDTPAIEVNLYIDFEKDNDLEQTAQLIEERLGQLEMVKEVEAVPEKARFTGLEVVAAIGVTVLVVRGSRELIEELRKLIPQLKGLMSEIK